MNVFAEPDLCCNILAYLPRHGVQVSHLLSGSKDKRYSRTKSKVVLKLAINPYAGQTLSAVFLTPSLTSEIAGRFGGFFRQIGISSIPIEGAPSSNSSNKLAHKLLLLLFLVRYRRQTRTVQSSSSY